MEIRAPELRREYGWEKAFTRWSVHIFFIVLGYYLAVGAYDVRDYLHHSANGMASKPVSVVCPSKR